MTSIVLPDLNAPRAEWVDCYAGLGWKLFPCRGKVPLFPVAHPDGDPLRGTCHGACGKVGHGLYDATDDPFTLATWWRQHPTANIGWAMGERYYTLDVDPRAGGDATFFDLERRYGTLGHTLLSHTGGGGSHYPFLSPPGGIVNKAPIGQGIDVQGNGAYIILPPSVHPGTGNPYMWDLVDGLDALLPARGPAWLEHLIMPAAGSTGTAAASKALGAPGAPIPAGHRNTTLAHLMVNLLRGGLSEEATLAALRIENQRCTPPLDDAELVNMVRGRASRYPPHPVMLLPTPQAQANGTWPHASNGTSSAGEQWGAQPYKLSFEDVSDIWSRHYELPRWLIEDLVPEGLTYLVGSQKSGKTYLTYSLALALATATIQQKPWLDFFPIKLDGPVYYLSLEDTDNMFWKRVHQLMPGLATFPKDRFFFKYDPLVPSLGEGLIDTIYNDIIKPYQPALVVIDPISYVSGLPQTARGADQFAAFRKMALPLRAMMAENHVPLVGVEHRRKKSADDVDIFETQHGTQAKGTIADATLVIVRETEDITLHARVRDAREQTLTIGFTFTNNCASIVYKGSHEGLLDPGQYGGLRQKVLTVLMTTPRPMSMPEILAAVGIPESKQAKNALYQVLFRAEKGKEIQKTTRGMWVWAGVNGP